MRGELRTPLRGSMEPALTEEAVQRIWRSVSVRRAKHVRDVKRTLSRPRAPRALTAGLAFAAAFVVFMVWASPRLNARAGAGPLVLAGGAKIGLLQAIVSAAMNAALEHGTLDAPTRATTDAPTQIIPAARPASVARPAIKAPSFRDLALRGDYKGAYQSLGEAGFAREARARDVETLLLLADIARLSGHPESAVGALARVIREHSSDPRASLSAFTIGKLELDSLGQPARAVGSFRSALDLGLDATLVEDARASIVEALARAGDSTGARDAAIDYERRFPNGRRIHDVRRWAAGE